MRRGPVVVIGATNLDLHFVATSGPMTAGTSNPSRVTLSAGGVGRNIAENLSRWGASVVLFSSVGDDPLSRSLLEATAAVGVDVSRISVVDGATCGLYAALLHEGGELAMAASAMEVTAAIDDNMVRSGADAIASAELLVLDANVGESTMQTALEIANSRGVPVVVEPVSVDGARGPVRDGGRAAYRRFGRLRRDGHRCVVGSGSAREHHQYKERLWIVTDTANAAQRWAGPSRPVRRSSRSSRRSSRTACRTRGISKPRARSSR